MVINFRLHHIYNGISQSRLNDYLVLMINLCTQTVSHHLKYFSRWLGDSKRRNTKMPRLLFRNRKTAFGIFALALIKRTVTTLRPPLSLWPSTGNMPAPAWQFCRWTILDASRN